jgi:hypothetical protein
MGSVDRFTDRLEVVKDVESLMVSLSRGNACFYSRQTRYPLPLFKNALLQIQVSPDAADLR